MYGNSIDPGLAHSAEARGFYHIYLPQRRILADFYTLLPEESYDYRMVDGADTPRESFLHRNALSLPRRHQDRPAHLLRSRCAVGPGQGRPADRAGPHRGGDVGLPVERRIRPRSDHRSALGRDARRRRHLPAAGPRHPTRRMEPGADGPPRHGALPISQRPLGLRIRWKSSSRIVYSHHPFECSEGPSGESRPNRVDSLRS